MTNVNKNLKPDKLSEFTSQNNAEKKATLNCRCDHSFKELVFEYKEPPEGETDFGFSKNEYYRNSQKCSSCNHYFSFNNMDMDNFYQDRYVNSTYGGFIHEKFKKIISLPRNKSDNYWRVKRLSEYIKEFFKDTKKNNLLDIGSGLGIFPYAMKKAGFLCTALDPDPKAAKHIREELKIDTIEGDLFKIKTNKKFNIATLNKVLEHVYDPVKMLKKTSEFVENGGLIYIELPDGEIASKYGKNREEFFIEHHHVFSFNSLLLMAESANLIPLKIERINELKVILK